MIYILKNFAIALPFIIILCSSTCSKPQSYVDYSIVDQLNLEDKKYYELGKYRIYPSEKRILIHYNTSSGIQRTHWEGCTLDSIINFDSTTLFFVGNGFDFKEHINNKIDLNSLKVLDYNIDDFYSKFYYIDKNAFYNQPIQDSSANDIDISAMKRLNDWLYQDKQGAIHYISATDFRRLWKVDLNGNKPDWTTLTHVADNCFADKNGLYNFDKDYSQYKEGWTVIMQKLESSNGRILIPEIGIFYIIYGENVYLREYDKGIDARQEIEKLNMSVSALKEYILDNISSSYIAILSDGNNSYFYPKDHRKLNEKISIGNTSDWKQFTNNSQRFIYDDRKYILYFSSHHHTTPKGVEISGALIDMGNGYNLIGNFNSADKDKITYVDKIFIYTQSGYEELEPDKYKYIGDDLYIYKGILYGNICTPIKEYTPDGNNILKPIKHKGVLTEYFTDGEILFFNNKMYSFTVQDDDKYPRPSQVFTDVDFNSLKVITKQLLIDKNNIYDNGKITPIDSLGVKVKIVN